MHEPSLSPDQPQAADRRRQALLDRLRHCPVMAIVNLEHENDAPQALERLEALLAAGLRLVQLRTKNLCDRARLEIARAARTRTRHHDAALLINDRVDIALASEADGVHLGADDLPPAAARALLGPQRWIGRTVHTEHDIPCARHADYAGVGTVYPSGTKPERPAAGLERLRELGRALAPLPVFAIGGIDAHNARACFAAGAHAVAVAGALARSTDPAQTLRAIIASAAGATP